MSTSTRDSYREAADALTPSAVSQYLAAQHWRLDRQTDGIKEIWSLPDDQGRARARVMLPLAQDFVDFRHRFLDALLALGRIYDADPVELQEQIAATRADLFFVRLDQAMPDGTIPFRQAEATLEALYKLLKAAATTAANPAHSHQGRRPAKVNDFLEDDVRLAHTKKGSFVFTVVTRLGDAERASTLQQQESARFPREVMVTLARGLHTTRNLARQWTPDVLDSPSDHGLSAGLVESLEDMTQFTGLRSLDLSFQWAPTEDRPEVPESPIVLDREVIEELPSVREQLIRQEEPARRETVVGFVSDLSRQVFGDDDVAEVIIRADVQGRFRNVHVTLSGEGHEWAIFAYRNKVPFTVTGDLSFERRAWRLIDAVVDTEFLRHVTRRDTPPQH